MTAANRIVAENLLPGSPETEWDVNGSGDPSLQGFATDVSVNHGETIGFKIRTVASRYRIDIYRLGHYGGLGARLITTIRPSVPLPQVQPDCLTEPETKLLDCGNWALSATWPVPADAVSGLYIARPVREDPAPPATGRHDNGQLPPRRRFAGGPPIRLANEIREPRASHIYFVVRDDEGRSDVLFQTADPTWQAYNRYGGSSTYRSWVQGDPMRSVDRAYKVSFNRPLTNRDWHPMDAPLNDHYPLIRWLERQGYDVSYFAGVDSDRMGPKILEHRLFLANGHDEYWSAAQRKHVEAARDAGVHLVFMTGNGVFWKTRYEASLSDPHASHRTLVVYKETHSRLDEHGRLQAGRKLDPMREVWTGTWRDASEFNPEGPQPENALMGQLYTVDGYQNSSLLVPAEYGRLRFWRHTGVAKAKRGEVTVLNGANLGHEFDEDIDNGFRPPGLIHLSQTTVNNVPYVQDWGSTFASGTATHHLTLYRAASGALVFSAGTVQWAWGLDGHHDRASGLKPEREDLHDLRLGRDPRSPDARVEQATINLLADMGVQPGDLQPHLVRAEPSTDSSPPVSRMTPAPDGLVLRGGRLTIRGTARDEGGGVVGGVEVSVDGGATWHPARGRERWTYSWVPAPGLDHVTVMSRAVDDSGNLEGPAPGVAVQIRPRPGVRQGQ